MPFTNYTARLAPGRAGDPFDIAIAKDDISLIAAFPQARQVSTIAITAANATTYTITVEGVAVSFLSDANATQTEIAAGLRAALMNDPAISGLISVVAATNLVLTSRQAGLAYTIAVGANLALTATTPNAAAAAVPFGAAIAFDPADTAGDSLVDDREQGGALLSSLLAGSAPAVQTFTVTAENAALYRITLNVDGTPYVVSVISSGAATTTTVATQLRTAINTTLDIPGVTATGTTTLIVTGDPGVSLQAASFTNNLALAENAGASVSTLQLFAGISLRQDTEESGGLVDGYSPHRTMSVRRLGRVRVRIEDTPTKGAPVFVRVDTGSGTIFRSTPADGCVRLAGWQFYKVEEGGLAIIQA